jgi:hypothetical protein
VSDLKVNAVKDDANGYYAARVLADILPSVVDLDGVNVVSASNEIQQAKAGPNRKIYEGE